MAALAPYLKAAAATLTRLELAANGITVTGAETLGGAPSGSAVAYLELSGNAIGDPGVYRPAITGRRSRSSVARQLDWRRGRRPPRRRPPRAVVGVPYVGLNKNRVGDGAAVLAAALGAKRSAVATLKLDNNDVGDAGAGARRRDLEGPHETLRLVGNLRIGAGAAAFAAAQRTKVGRRRPRQWRV